MADLTTRYMGIELKNPVIAGASRLTANMETIGSIERAGAGALVISSLFEEEIELERFKHDEDLHKYDDHYSEMITIYPDVPFRGPVEHLMWVRKAKEAVKIPVFASLNAVHRDTWVEYATRLEETGVDGLELNFFHTPLQPARRAEEVETERLDILREIRRKVHIPIAVKLSHFYTNPIGFIHRLDDEGVNGFVLFNRLFQPDIDPDAERHLSPLNLSEPADSRLPLRYAGLLHGDLKADICASTGIFTGRDVARMILAGAACIQTVSALYKSGIGQIYRMLQELAEWMDGKSYQNLAAFRGKMSAKNTSSPWMYRRDQYVHLLMHPEEIINNFPAERYH